MKKFVLLAVLLVLIACTFHPGEKEIKKGRLYPAWVMTGEKDSTSLFYRPGKLEVNWFLTADGDNPGSLSQHSPGCRDSYQTEPDTGFIARGYYTRHIQYNGHDLRSEIAVNEKEMVIKMTNESGDHDTVYVKFTVSFLPGSGFGFDQQKDILEAYFAGERIYFHHYGPLSGTVYTDSLYRSQTLRLSDSIYFYSGDELSPIYLDKMIARKRTEQFTR
ncbi:MAG TPA: hypothetical protein VE870_08110 [Bacteroidales bacterium]|nr:hypothetical protein [Bacteroidales bacterium]